MAITPIGGFAEAAPAGDGVPPGPRVRRRRATVFASLVVACALVGLNGYETAEAGLGPTTSRGRDAWSRRLEAEAEAFLSHQANIARGRAADAARLQAAADARGGTDG